MTGKASCLLIWTLSQDVWFKHGDIQQMIREDSFPPNRLPYNTEHIRNLSLCTQQEPSLSGSVSCLKMVKLTICVPTVQLCLLHTRVQ